jgi:hypothetical protein
MRRPILVSVILLVLVGAAVPTTNWVMVGRPVSEALSGDSRNEGTVLTGRLQYRLNPRVLVLDLREPGITSAADLLRMVFHAAETLHERERSFERVILARSGQPVFVLEGRDFYDLGREFGWGQNPVYLMRTFPSKLYHPNGRSAYGSWEGGWLGVLAREMEDVNAAMQAWVRGG